MMKVEYGRYIIEVFSNRSGGKWRPDIRISRRSGDEIHNEQLPPPESVVLDSPAESDACGVQLAKAVIDSRG
jgi:hypothetical protein